MAGWDSDAIAERLEQALERQQEAAEARLRRNPSSPEELRRDAQRESLRLSLSRIEEQLSRATSPAHRATLEKALAALRKQQEEEQSSEESNN
jgi:hypothetical protein